MFDYFVSPEHIYPFEREEKIYILFHTHSYMSSSRFIGAMRHYQPWVCSSIVFPPLINSVRFQSSDQFHRYLHNPHIVQPDGLDSLPRTKGDQQQWLNTEQWDGYSETYLMRHMQYGATAEHPNTHYNYRHDDLYKCLGLVYELYGVLADALQDLHDNPLDPLFHKKITQIKQDREKIAAELDKVYAPLHPTVKTVYDAYLVRRYYFLEDWIKHVERKREEILERLSPEFIEQMEKARGVAAHFMERLKCIEYALYNNPILALMPNDQLEQYSDNEIVLLRQKAAYFRKMKRFGSNQYDADVNTH